jgi:hypothetical protein
LYHIAIENQEAFGGSAPRAWQRPFKSVVGLFRFASERFGGESRKPSEERFGKRFPFFGRKFQVLLDFRF